MRGNPTTVRWGDRRVVSVDPFSSVTETQFVDLDFVTPRELVISLIATAPPPMAGLACTWIVYQGAGAAMVKVPLTVPVSDEAAPVVVVQRFSVRKLRLTAVVSSTFPGVPRDVVLEALVGPVFGEAEERSR